MCSEPLPTSLVSSKGTSGGGRRGGANHGAATRSRTPICIVTKVHMARFVSVKYQLTNDTVNLLAKHTPTSPATTFVLRPKNAESDNQQRHHATAHTTLYDTTPHHTVYNHHTTPHRMMGGGEEYCGCVHGGRHGNSQHQSGGKKDDDPGALEKGN